MVMEEVIFASLVRSSLHTFIIYVTQVLHLWNYCSFLFWGSLYNPGYFVPPSFSSSSPALFLHNAPVVLQSLLHLSSHYFVLLFQHKLFSSQLFTINITTITELFSHTYTQPINPHTTPLSTLLQLLICFAPSSFVLIHMTFFLPCALQIKITLFSPFLSNMIFIWPFALYIVFGCMIKQTSS